MRTATTPAMLPLITSTGFCCAQVTGEVIDSEQAEQLARRVQSPR